LHLRQSHRAAARERDALGIEVAEEMLGLLGVLVVQFPLPTTQARSESPWPQPGAVLSYCIFASTKS
jgi:hypothetical protein